jgi:hypothetical protein
MSGLTQLNSAIPVMCTTQNLLVHHLSIAAVLLINEYGHHHVSCLQVVAIGRRLNIFKAITSHHIAAAALQVLAEWMSRGQSSDISTTTLTRVANGCTK